MGVNWFGFETSSTMLDGLWEGPDAITQNFQAVLWRIKLLGFNTVRVPFSFQVSFPSTPHCCRLHRSPLPGCFLQQKAAAVLDSSFDGPGRYG